MDFSRFARRAAGLGALAIAATLGLGGPARADMFIISGGHWDIDVEYHDGELEIHWHLHGTSVEYDADEALLFVNPANTAFSRPGGSQWDFLGVGAGETVYILPADEPADLTNLVWLGVGAEGIPPGTFSPNNVRLSLVDFTGPGHFSMFTTNAFGTPSVIMSTSNGIGDEDFINLTLGSHRHPNWAFTAQGLYGLTFVATATLPNGQAISSERTTFYFGVGTTEFPGGPGDPGGPGFVIPEPASLAMMGMGVLAVGGASALRRRKASRREAV